MPISFAVGPMFDNDFVMRIRVEYCGVIKALGFVKP